MSIAGLLSLMTTTAYGFGVTDSDVDESDYMGEVPYVLTVSRLSQPVSAAPAAVTVIDRDMIRASGIVDLPEIFRLVPGFYVGVNAGYVHNTNHAVSYHGMTSAYSGSMQVLIDGRSVYSPLYGGVQWSELPIALSDIERIEITRGPNAASYGANSYFGVINIITQDPSQLDGQRVIATHGNGRNEIFYRFADNVGDWHYRVTAGYREDDGLQDRNDFKRTRLLNASSNYQINNQNSIEFEFGIVDGARGEGHAPNDPILFVPRTKQINNHYQLVRWRHTFSAGSDFSLQAYHSFDRSDDETTSVNLRPLIDAAFPGFGAALLNDTVTIDNRVETERYDVEAQHNFSVGRDWRFVWGANVRQDSLYAPFYLATTKKDYFNLQRLFGHVEWQPHRKLTINAGAMLERNDFTGTDTSPRLSANFHITPKHTLRLGVSTALRTPNYVEEKFDRSVEIPTILPNTTLLFRTDFNLGNIDPERIISREIGYIGQLGRVSLDGRLFYDTISDHIRSTDASFTVPAGFIPLNDPLEDIEGFVNAGSAAVHGFEMQAKWHINRQANLLFNFSHVRIRETKSKLTKDFKASMPSNSVSALLTHRFDDNWDGSLAYYQTSEATLLGDGKNVDLIRKCDVRLARKFHLNRLSGEVSAVVENLFNDQYQEFSDYNTSRRRFRLNLMVNF